MESVLKKTVGDTGTSHPHVQLPQPSQSIPSQKVPEHLITTEEDSIIIDSTSGTIIKKSSQGSRNTANEPVAQ